MSENNLAQSNNLPEKSNLWLAGNIAAGALLANIAVKFIGGMIFGQFILENFVLRLIYTIAIILTGAYLGSKFGIQYAVKQSIINPDKIDSISKATAVIPFLFLLIVIIQNIYVSSSGMEKFEFPFFDLLGTLIFTLAVFYFCKKFLLEFVEKTPRNGQLTNSTVSASDKNGNGVKILIGFIILAIIGISMFFIWKLFKKDIVLITPVITPNATMTPLATTIMPTSIPTNNSEILSWETFKSNYFSFEIKYSLDWIANENVQNISTVKDGDWWPLDTLPKNNAKVLFEKTGVASVQEIINEKFGSASNNSIISDNIIDINGLKSRQIVYTCKNCQEKYIQEIDKNVPGEEGKMVFFEQENNNVFYLSLVYYKNDPRAVYYMEIFNQMLSTFKFVENKETANWKTYESVISAQFPSEKYTIKYPADWSYAEKRIAGSRQSGKLETIFRNNKNAEAIKIIAGDIFSNYQDKKYINKGEVSFGGLNLKFTKLEENVTGDIYYVFDTGKNMLADPVQKGYEEVIVFSPILISVSYFNNMVLTFEFGK